jgi:hypothetical protein
MALSLATRINLLVAINRTGLIPTPEDLLNNVEM